MPNSEEILQANEKLRNQISTFQNDLAAVTKREAKTRMVVYILIAAIVITFGLGIYNKSKDASDRAQINTDYLQTACGYGNDNRSKEHGFWLGILNDAASQKKNQTPAKQAQFKLIKSQLDQVYALRDCSKVKKGEVVFVTPSPTPAASPFHR